MNVFNKRILKDIIEIDSNPLHSYGIYHHYNDDNYRIIYVLMIGPINTPYEGGFFIFKIEFPNNYPIEPPIVHLETLDRLNRVRFNPNLYESGKVCLSLLNTWNGPGWSPCNTISSVLVTIFSSIFINEPLRNEPGYNNASPVIINRYNNVIKHEVLRVATYNIINNSKHPSSHWKPFSNIMENHLKQHINTYIKRAYIYHSQYGNATIKSPIYRMHIRCDYTTIINQLYKFNIPNTYNKVILVTKTSRQVPNMKASLGEIGYEQLSENNNLMYHIKLKKNGVKYWCKLK
jgi:ubiquitin-protein ligase